MLRTLPLKQTSLPTSASIWARLLLDELTQAQQIPDALALMRRAGMAPDLWQAQVLRSTASRRLLLCCRQSGKSQTCAALALATALVEPGSLVLLLSPSLRQSAELFKRVADLQRSLPQVPKAESVLRLELPNGSRIISLPGTESTVRGYSGVRLLVIDEAARVPDDLYYSVRPMMAVSSGKMVALSTPFGQRGWFHHEYIEGEHWERVTITAEQCPRIPPAFLDEERRSLPPLWYRSEYQCEFVANIDSVFDPEFVHAAISSGVQPLF
jgi:hypothetical protein